MYYYIFIMYDATFSSSPSIYSAVDKHPSREQTIRLRGRSLTYADIAIIKNIVKENWSSGRSQLSCIVCESLGWRQDNGRLKDRACRDILRSLEQMELIKLPPSKSRKLHSTNHPNHALPENHPLAPSNMAPVTISNITSMSMVMVRWTKEGKLWNSLVETYHYLGYTLTVGSHLKYIVFDRNIPIACIGWGDAAWHVKDRDAWLGWSQEERRRNIKFVINNTRFLILPWVKIPNFASFILSRGIKAVKEDWEHIYGIRPLLLETFVDRDRFNGTCYRASNWIHVGSTKGYARRGYSYQNHNIVKDIFLYPLHRNIQCLLKDISVE